MEQLVHFDFTVDAFDTLEILTAMNAYATRCIELRQSGLLSDLSAERKEASIKALQEQEQNIRELITKMTFTYLP
jgi:hypothetical protein